MLSTSFEMRLNPIASSSELQIPYDMIKCLRPILAMSSPMNFHAARFTSVCEKITKVPQSFCYQ